MIDRRELQDSARKAFGEVALAPDAAKSWALISEMGWLMMAVPEALGGLGLGREALGVVHYEMGRALVPGPAIAQMLAIEALCAADGLARRDDLLARAMEGEVMTASLAPQLSLRELDVVIAVPDADRASHLLIDEVDYLRFVPLSDCTIARRETWDKGRRLFDVEVPDDAGTVIAEGIAAWALSKHLSSQLAFALAADSLGGADAILALTVDYLKTRRQFDRPLAMFQALKHRVADLKTQLAAAEALLWSRARDPDATPTDLGALKAHATRVYASIAEEAIQLHGGIGLTEEHHCHLFLKRAMLNAALGGDADHWEEAAGRDALSASNIL
jgi:alkylation response protein AidB-like acyl-CoA dehydrogenase